MKITIFKTKKTQPPRQLTLKKQIKIDKNTKNKRKHSKKDRYLESEQNRPKENKKNKTMTIIKKHSFLFIKNIKILNNKSISLPINNRIKNKQQIINKKNSFPPYHIRKSKLNIGAQ
ncbi:TPA: hypothetical protein J1281_002178 [Escherichia coli]|nr:hypothetical protein [Escherichia coli]HBA9542819.1 hypothetical protein [Escherichia coli]